MLVREIMHENPLFAAPGTPISEAIPLMVNRESSCLIIVDNNQPVGIITERDITRLASRLLQQPTLVDDPVESIMTAKPICVYADNIFKDALLISRSHHLRHLPVVNERYELVGIVTQDNLVDAYLRLIAKHDQLESRMENLKMLSLEDPLTGAGNRRAMEVELKHCQAQSERLCHYYAVALLDIDFFKKYNDHYGHQAGDETLKKVALSAQNALRDSDRFFRYGGEEFLVLMPNTAAEEALICAERVRSSIEALNIEHLPTEKGSLTVSLGVASSLAGDWQLMLKSADKALYAAKSAGRNRVELAKPIVLAE